MNSILESYKRGLEDFIIDTKWKIRESSDLDKTLESVRDELSQWGKEKLHSMFEELKTYVEKNNPEFIKNNREKWETILDKSKALTEYGLYVAPIDLFGSEDAIAKAAYVGAGTFVGSIVLTKLITKKAGVLQSLLASIIGGVAAYYLFDLNSEEDIKNTAINYIDDAKDWINTAFENMNRIFKDAQ